MDSRVSVDGPVEARWAEPLRQACATLAAMTDGDPTARVSIRRAEDDLVVEVTLADGRFTTRRLRTPAALGPTLEALVALPARPAPPKPPAIDTADPPRVVGGPTVGPAPAAPTAFGAELGGGIGMRGSSPGPYVAASVAAFIQVRGGPWLVGTEMRWDLFERVRGSVPDDFETETLALSLTVARRLVTSFGHVDLGGAPRFVSQTQSALPATGEESATEVDLRPAIFARAAFGHAPLRLIVEADADVSPTRLRRSLHALPDSPRLPSWSAGLAVGVEWGPS